MMLLKMFPVADSQNFFRKFRLGFLILHALFLSFFYLGCSSTVKVQEEEKPVQFFSKTEPTAYELGKPFDFVLTLDVPQKYNTLQIPEVGPGIHGPRIVGQTYDPARKHGGRYISERRYTLVCDFEGAFELPSVSLSVDSSLSLSTPAIWVEIKKGDKNPNEEDIEEIEEIKTISFVRSYRGWLVLFAILVCGILIWFFFFRKQKDQWLEVLISPQEWVSERILEIRSRELLEKEDYCEFSFLLGAALRGYVQRQFGVFVQGATTEEFLQKIEGTEISQEDAFKLKKVLSDGDLTQFASIFFTKDRYESHLKSLEEFVQKTHPKEEQEELEEVLDA